MAQYDTSIFQRVKPMSVDDYNAQADEADARKLTNETNRMNLLLQGRQVRAAQQAEDDQNRMMNILRGLPSDVTDADRVNALRGGGFFNQADSLEKSLIDRRKGEASAMKDEQDAQKQKILNAHTLLQHGIQSLQTADTRDQAIAAINDGVSKGYWSMADAQKRAASIPSDPAQYQQWRQNSLKAILDAKEQLPKIDTRNTGGSTETLSIDPVTGQTRVVNSVQNTQSPDNAATVAATIRGQNLTDARAREATAATMTKPFEVTGPDGTPMLVQQDKRGNVVPVQGFGPKAGAAKPLTEGQAKANLFGTRMQESHAILNDLADQGVTRGSLVKQGAEAVPLIGGGLGMLANSMATPQQQQVEQAQRDFVNAVLRRESGAAISSSEFDSAKKQYFPQPGDSREVMAQKKRNRETAIQGMLAEVPPGARPKPAVTQAAAPGGRPPLSAFEGK